MASRSNGNNGFNAEDAEKREDAEGRGNNEKETLDRLTREIISAAIEVHKGLGPGLLESAYRACLGFELRSRGLKTEQEISLPVTYRGFKVECGYRLDLLVEGSIVVEIKALETLLPVHGAQLLSYLPLSGCRVGLLMDFHVPVLKDGIRRIVNRYPDSALSSRSASSAPSALKSQ